MDIKRYYLFDLKCFLFKLIRNKTGKINEFICPEYFEILQ